MPLHGTRTDSEIAQQAHQRLWLRPRRIDLVRRYLHRLRTPNILPTRWPDQRHRGPARIHLTCTTGFIPRRSISPAELRRRFPSGLPTVERSRPELQFSSPSTRPIPKRRLWTTGWLRRPRQSRSPRWKRLWRISSTTIWSRTARTARPGPTTEPIRCRPTAPGLRPAPVQSIWRNTSAAARRLQWSTSSQLWRPTGLRWSGSTTWAKWSWWPPATRLVGLWRFQKFVCGI